MIDNLTRTKHSTLLLVSTWYILNNVDNKKKKSSLSLYRQRTNYQTNQWNTCITWRARRSSCSVVIVPERCASYNALFFVNDIILRSLFVRRATHFRVADCRSSGAFLTFEMLYKYEKVRVSSPHSSVETRMPWLDCVVSAQLRINWVLVPQLNRERTSQPSVTEVCVELFYCSVISVLLMQWCGKGVHVIRQQKSQGYVGLNMQTKILVLFVHYRQTQFLNPTPQRFTVMKKKQQVL